ncbi:hypothetical protein SFR_4620 [Streptomyces sp. FR-008]|nr:hypothetical protein SFR_4620 [Streptomyces sp. FR-008]
MGHLRQESLERRERARLRRRRGPHRLLLGPPAARRDVLPSGDGRGGRRVARSARPAP